MPSVANQCIMHMVHSWGLRTYWYAIQRSMNVVSRYLHSGKKLVLYFYSIFIDNLWVQLYLKEHVYFYHLVFSRFIFFLCYIMAVRFEILTRCLFYYCGNMAHYCTHLCCDACWLSIDVHLSYILVMVFPQTRHTGIIF